jgi:quercetin dioxygenase-like cupin family protein
MPVVLTADAIAAIPAEPLGNIAGVANHVVWRNGTSMAGVLAVEAGRRLGTHAHSVNHHHIWVLEGHAKILGTDVGPGSYVHVPRGVDHDIDASASEGCNVFYLYLRPGD